MRQLWRHKARLRATPIAIVQYIADHVDHCKAAYSNSIKKFGFARRDSMSGILMDLSLPSADAVVHNSCCLLTSVLCPVTK